MQLTYTINIQIEPSLYLQIHCQVSVFLLLST